MRNTYAEKQVLLYLIRIEMEFWEWEVQPLASQLMIPESMLLEFIMGNVHIFTVEKLFELLQKIYHDRDIFELERLDLLLDYDDFTSLREALATFFKQPRCAVNKRVRSVEEEKEEEEG